MYSNLASIVTCSLETTDFKNVVRNLCANLLEFYFLARETKIVTDYWLFSRSPLRWEFEKARMSYFPTTGRCLNYLENLACNCDIHALFPLSWLSYSAFHDASPFNFDSGKLDWEFSRFSARSLRPFFRFLVNFSLPLRSIFVLATLLLLLNLCIRAALNKR